MPLVSVNLVTYNHEKYIGEALRSVLDQTFSDLEVVVVNDGSTDGTRACIEACSDPRVVAIHQENQGPAAATNRGLSACRGRYVALMSGDDLCHPDRIRRQLDEYGRGGRRVLFSGVDYIDDDSKPLTSGHFASDLFFKDNLPRSGILGRFFHHGNYFNAITAFTERDIFLEAGGYDPVLLQLQDFDLWVRLVRKYDLWIMPDRLAHYRIRLDNQNLSSPEPAKQVASLNEQYLILRRFFDGVPLELFKEAFAGELKNADLTTQVECAAEQVFLYLHCRHPLGRLIGLEKLAGLVNEPEAGPVLRERYGLTPVHCFETLRSLNVLNLFAGHESAVFLDTGNGWNDQERVSTWTNLDWRDFCVTFRFPSRPMVRALGWNPMQYRMCRVHIDAASYGDGDGIRHSLDVASLQTNGVRMADGMVAFDTVHPMFVLPVKGTVDRLTITGQWEYDEMPKTIRKLDQKLDQVQQVLVQQTLLLREKDRQMEELVNSRSWRMLAPLRRVRGYLGGRKPGANGTVLQRRAS
jgi:glycosyltransferase involved in cell wall biosynthesis